MDLFYRLFLHTPWWVYLLLIYLLRVGVKATQTRVVSLKFIFILPAIFTYISLYTLFKTVNIHVFTLSTWLFSILTGMVLGWWQNSQHELKVDRQKGLLQVPGTWSTLVIILVIFAAKYYFNYELSIHPTLAANKGFAFKVLFISGICTGLFIGRMLCFLFRFYTQASVNLS